MTTSEPSSPSWRAVGGFRNLETTEQALQALERSGYDMQRVSVLAQDAARTSQPGAETMREEPDGQSAGTGATTGAVTGGTLGTLTGLLVGLGSLAVPGAATVFIAGAEVAALTTTLAGGAVGAMAGGLVGALIGLGIPRGRAVVYRDRIYNGDYLLTLTGTEAEIRQAERILHEHGIEEWGVFATPQSSRLGSNADVIVIDRHRRKRQRSSRRSNAEGEY